MEEVIKEKCNCKCNCHATGGAVYGLGLVGALVYYFQHATSFWIGVLGFLKALVWPAMLAYKLLEFLSK